MSDQSLVLTSGGHAGGHSRPRKPGGGAGHLAGTLKSIVWAPGLTVAVRSVVESCEYRSGTIHSTLPGTTTFCLPLISSSRDAYPVVPFPTVVAWMVTL